jgi:hypothetical protein
MLCRFFWPIDFAHGLAIGASSGLGLFVAPALHRRNGVAKSATPGAVSTLFNLVLLIALSAVLGHHF